MLHDIERFLIATQQAGRSPTTLRQYRWHLHRLAAWLEDRQILDAAQVDRDTLRRWGASLYDGWAPATVKQAICACRAFFRWLHAEGNLPTDPAQALSVPKVPKRVQRTITEDEVRRMIAVCDSTPKGTRDRTLVITLIDTGLRAAEVCRAQVSDLYLEEQVLAITVKGGDRDLAHFGHTTRAALEAWLEVRAEVARPEVGHLFVSVGGLTPGRPLTTRGLRIIVRRLGEKAGIAGVSPHALRRGFACIATAAGAPSRVVQLAGRWSTIGMVERYTRALQRGGLHERWSPADYCCNHDP